MGEAAKGVVSVGGGGAIGLGKGDDVPGEVVGVGGAEVVSVVGRGFVVVNRGGDPL